MGVYIWNKLPSEYQEVEYIQSDTSNVQYINTGYLPTSNPKIELDFMYINGVETTDYVWFDIYGRRGSTNSTYIGMYINNPNGYVSPNYAGFDPGQNSGVTISKNTRYYHIQDRGQFYLNGTKYANASTTNTLATANYPIFLFGSNIQGAVQGRVKSMRVYSCKMWNDGVLVRNFIPCYRKSDSVVGLYDLVNNQFYTNSGSGTFTKGSDVNTYRESSLKNAYIGEAYEYSYDFRNKNSTDLSNAGWSYTGTLETGANGVTAPNRYDIQLYKTFDFSNANRITITATTQWSTNDSIGRHIQFGCSNLSNSVVLMLSAANYQTSKIDLYNGTHTYGTDLGNIGTSTYTSTLEIDLVNKTVNGTIPGLGTSTLTLSDAQVTMIRGLPYLWFYTTQHTFYMQDIRLTIE